MQIKLTWRELLAKSMTLLRAHSVKKRQIMLLQEQDEWLIGMALNPISPNGSGLRGLKELLLERLQHMDARGHGSIEQHDSYNRSDIKDP